MIPASAVRAFAPLGSRGCRGVPCGTAISEVHGGLRFSKGSPSDGIHVLWRYAGSGATLSSPAGTTMSMQRSYVLPGGKP